mmetsp:Transcript_11379/g.18230  ORF Transcript_11379/g.18230 Transcript_11379/m.18230 type:complete len:483 (-) Transcript_11379:181-1629(-)
MEGHQLLALQWLLRATLLLQAHHDTVQCAINILPHDLRPLLAGCENGSFVEQVLQGGAREPRAPTSNRLQVHIRGQGFPPGVHLEDVYPALEVGQVHRNLSVETTRSEKSLIKDINSVGGSNDNDAVVTLKTIHLHEDLVERLFPLIIPTTLATATGAAHGINLINKDDARSILFGFIKQASDTTGTNTYKHLHKLRACAGDEGHASLTGNRLGQKGLTSTRGALHDHTTWDSGTKRSVLFRLLQEVHHFLQLSLGSVASRDIIEVNTSVRADLNLFAVVHHAHRVIGVEATSACTPSREEKEKTSEKETRQQETSKATSTTTIILLLLCKDSDVHLVLNQKVGEIRISWKSIKFDTVTVCVHCKNLLPIRRKCDLLNFIGFNHLQELCVPNLSCSTCYNACGRGSVDVVSDGRVDSAHCEQSSCSKEGSSSGLEVVVHLHGGGLRHHGKVLLASITQSFSTGERFHGLNVISHLESFSGGE